MPRRISVMRSISYPNEFVVIRPYPEIVAYVAVLDSGIKIKKSISSFCWLLHHLSFHSQYTIRKLIFHFAKPVYHSHYYPYGKHNIVLEQTQEQSFRVQFYHYFNVKNERVDIPIQQQYYDFCALEQLLFQHPILYYSFYSKLFLPTFPCYNTPYGIYQTSYPDQTSYQERVTETPNDSISYVTVCDSTSH